MSLRRVFVGSAHAHAGERHSTVRPAPLSTRIRAVRALVDFEENKLIHPKNRSKSSRGPVRRVPAIRYNCGLVEYSHSHLNHPCCISE